MKFYVENEMRKSENVDCSFFILTQPTFIFGRASCVYTVASDPLQRQLVGASMPSMQSINANTGEDVSLNRWLKNDPISTELFPMSPSQRTS